MNKAYLLSLALLLPVHAGAVEQDSVYTWGQWANGVKPAAGPVAKVTPPPAQTPDVNFRANEASALLREAVTTPPRNIITGIGDANPSTPIQVAPPTSITPPPPPPALQ